MTQEPGDDFLDSLADAILDGPERVDALAGDDPERQAALRQAEILARIADVHRAAASETDDASTGPRTWGRLEVIEELGRGSSGVVYRARDPRLEREVALKLLWTGGADPDRFITAMVEEGRLLARIHHPNVVGIYDANVIDGRVGLTMELVRGSTLTQLVHQGGPLPVDEVRRVGTQLAGALAAVHEAGLLHRDVKAQNVMRRADSRYVLMDFGAGRQVDEASDNAAITGTPLYLAPELLDGQRATVQSDIYSLGVLLFYLLTAQYPVTGNTVRELRESHRAGQRASLTQLRPEVDPSLREIIERCLAPAPSRRYVSAVALLEALASGSEVRPSSRKSKWTALALAGLLVASAAVFSLIPRDRPEKATVVASPPPASTSPILGNVPIPAGDTMAVTGSQVAPEATALPAPPNASLSIVRLGAPDAYLFGQLSSDGRLLPYSDKGGTRLMVHDLRSNEDRVIVEPGPAPDGTIEYAVVSRDGTRIAYSWETPAARELRVVDIQSRIASPRPILRDTQEGPVNALAVLAPVDWTPDGSAVLALRARAEGVYDIALVSVNDGTVRPLKQGLTSLTSVHLSHDGRYVAFDYPVPSDSDARDIAVLSLETGEEEPVVTGSAHDAVPLWLPHDDGILFTSDRSGAVGLWIAPVANGHPGGLPRTVGKDMGRMQSIALAKDGTLFYSVQSGAVDVYDARLAADGTVVADSIRPGARSYLGSNLDPEWSPDGRALAYVSRRRAMGPRAQALVISPRDQMPDRVLWPDLQGFTEPRWSPDQRLIFVRGNDRSGRRGPFLIDAQNGDVLSRVNGPAFVDVEWARDRNTLFVIADNAISALEPGGEARREIYRDPRGRRLIGLAVSPDGTSFAITLNQGDADTIAVVPAAGGESRDLITITRPDIVLLQEWARDGKSVLLSRGRLDASGMIRGEWSVWSVGVADGGIRPLNLAGPGLRNVKVSPDGSHIAYRAGEPGWDYWLMRNFLPASSTSRIP